MSNWLRPAFTRAGAFAAAVIIMVAFVFLSIRGVAPATIPWYLNIFGSHPHARLYPEPVLSLILPRLPLTFELLIGSFVLAAGVALAISAAAAHVPLRWRRIVESVALPLRAVPFVWLAAVAVLIFIHNSHTELGASALPYFDLRDQLAHLWYPALVLALFEIPLLVNVRSARDILRAFAKTLPEILGALVVTETLFGWPGDGTLFYRAISMGAPSLAVALLLLASFGVLLVRAVAADA